MAKANFMRKSCPSGAPKSLWLHQASLKSPSQQGWLDALWHFPENAPSYYAQVPVSPGGKMQFICLMIWLPSETVMAKSHQPDMAVSLGPILQGSLPPPLNHTNYWLT